MEPTKRRVEDLQNSAQTLMGMKPHLIVAFAPFELHFLPLGQKGRQKLQEAKNILQQHGFEEKDFRQREAWDGFYLAHDRDGTKKEKTANRLYQFIFELKTLMPRKTDD